MSSTRIFLVLLAVLVLRTDARPAVDQEPVRFSLDTGKDEGVPIDDKPLTLDVSTRIQDGMELMSETRNNVAGAIGAANDIIVKGRSTLQSYDKTPLAQFFPPRTRENTRLENEQDQALFEKKKTNNPISSFLESIVKPKPIVDNIKEEDKYGNNGDKFIGVGRALVNGFEGLSNFLNAVVDLPVNAAKKTSRNITEALNQIGSRLVGLQ
ncbi:uncharacterized protein LOC100118466 isoform X2 [Nasonia vitripennis]|uniref:Uncharacterized protein n=1 Tax=Nasonia vitripennis TaxID=7425 RepID=A0A7M7G4Z9_NASVI|nr:uncharacterized protein LOC100118466 isoform X2 [Nasonia vitripennis]